MIRKKMGIFGTCVLLALLISAFIGAYIYAQAMIDLSEGRIADGLDMRWDGSVMYAYAASESAPVIETLEVEGVTGSVNAGDSFKVVIGLNSSDLKITGSGVVFVNEQTGTSISAGGDSVALVDGKYITVKVSENAKGGVYAIERIVLRDADLNTHIYYNPDLYKYDYSADTKTALTEEQRKLSLTVLSSDTDSAPPTLISYEIEKSEVTAGEEIIFAVEAEDAAQTGKDVFNNDVTYAASGLNSIRVSWQRQPESGETSSLLGKYTFSTNVSFADLKKNGNVYQGTFKVPSALVTGKYVVKNIEIDDKSGNSTVYVNPEIDIWNDIYGSIDSRNKLSDEICAIYMDISGTKTGNGASATSAASVKADTSDTVQTSSKTAVKSVITLTPTVQSFEKNSFGKLAAYLTLKGTSVSDDDAELDDDTLAYVSQSFRFSVTADYLAIEDNSSLSVGMLVDGDDYDNARLTVKNKAARSVVFDIDLLDQDGVSVQPDGIVSISTDLPEDFDSSKVSVYRLAEDGVTCSKLDSTISGSRVTFDTDHFSVFVIAQDADGAVTAASPGTADEAPLAALSFVLVSALAAWAINARKMRSQKM